MEETNNIDWNKVANTIRTRMRAIRKNTDIGDVLVWGAFVLWCIRQSPKTVKHSAELDALRTANELRRGDMLWNIANDAFPYVVALLAALVIARLLKLLAATFKEKDL